MDFMALALLSAFFFSFSTVVDKYILTNRMKDGFAYFYLLSIVTGILYPFILIGLGRFVMPFDAVPGLIIFSAVVFANVAVVYYTLRLSDASLLSPLLSSGAIFTVTFSAIFLSEWSGFLVIAFILIAVLGAVISAADEKTSARKILSVRVFWLAMLANILGAASIVILRVFLQGMDGFNILAWRQIIWLPLSLLLLPVMLNKKRMSIIKNNWKHALPYTILSALILFTAISFSYIAFQQSVQITSGLLASSGLFTVILSFIISRIKPSIINERHKRSVYVIRAAGAIIIFIGVAGIFLSR